MNLSFKFRRWLDHKFKNGVYEFQNGEIIWRQGWRRDHRIKIDQLRSWRIYPEMIFDVVILELSDGQEIQLLDTYNDLIGILQNHAGDKEAE